MTPGQRLSACACLAAALLSLGACAGGGGSGNTPSANANASGTPAAAAPSPASGTAVAETGVEKVKPAPGTGNVQGKVLFNGKPATGIEVKQEYPDAAYYKFSLYPSEASVTSPYVNQRVEGTTFAADKPLPGGEYRWQMEAYNAADHKLAESARDFKFTVTDGS